MHVRPVLYRSDGELLDEDMYVLANLTTRRHSVRKEIIGSGERIPILVFLPLNCIGKVVFCMAYCILQTRAGAMVNDGNVE